MRNTIWIASAGQIASVFAQRIGVAVMAFVILTSFAIAYAEDPDGNPHQRSTDFRRAPGIQLCRALYIQSVRKKVGLSEEDFVLLRKSIGFLSTSFPTVEEFSKGSSQDREVLLETIAREAEKLEPEVWSMVSRMIGREGIDILMGLYIKYHGYGAILNERIADRMRLSSEHSWLTPCAATSREKDI